MNLRKGQTVCNKPGIKVVFLCLLLLTSGALYCQGNAKWTDIGHSVKFKKLTTGDGLSQSSVLCILQDRQGFMWFGTEDGLNRYDGYDFTIYRPDPNTPYTISGNRISALKEDRAGDIWVGTNGGGLNKFQRETGRFFSYQNTESPRSISDDNIHALLEDRDGTLWIGTLGGGLNRLSPAKDPNAAPTFIRYKHDPADPQSLPSDNIWELFQDHVFLGQGDIG